MGATSDYIIHVTIIRVFDRKKCGVVEVSLRVVYQICFQFIYYFCCFMPGYRLEYIETGL